MGHELRRNPGIENAEPRPAGGHRDPVREFLLRITGMFTGKGHIPHRADAVATRDNRHRWQRWPLSLGIAFVPMLIVGAMLESLNERYLKIPLIVVGIGWAYLGFVVFRGGESS